MSFFSILNDFQMHEKLQSLNFAADPNLRRLLILRIQEIKAEINSSPPLMETDAHKYFAKMRGLHDKKQELEDLVAVLQEIEQWNKNPQEKKE